MRRLVSTALLLLLLLAVLAAPLSVHAQGSPKISVKSQFILDRYGFATINESVRFVNNGSSAVSVPAITFAFGNLSSLIVKSNLTGSGFSLASPASPGGAFTVSSTLTLQAKANATFVFSALVNGIVSQAKNGSLKVLTLSSPAISPRVDTLLNVVKMPVSTTFRSPPAGLKANLAGSNNTYSSSTGGTSAVTSVRSIASSTVQDFYPLHVYSAQRTITAGPNGSPLVTEKVRFHNGGTTAMSLLYVNLLAPAGTKVTILTPTEPRLINPVTVPLTNNAINLFLFAVGYPNNGVPAGTNFTLTYQYPLGSTHYSVAGGKVTLNIPESPPVKAFVDSYLITMSLPQGAISSQSAPVSLTAVTPWQSGATAFSYGLSVGWSIDAGVPAASVVFLLLLIGLFASRTTTAQEAETEEEETSTELASDMIMAFDEKTTLINNLWQEISAKDPNEMDKKYFDELRGRLDSFRSRALQRLNEVKQKSASQKFYEVVNQIQATEREVDRAAKDKLNLYQQYYLRQMRKEVFERLLPQYTKRLEKALNQLSDELHTVQRESKLL